MIFAQYLANHTSETKDTRLKKSTAEISKKKVQKGFNLRRIRPYRETTAGHTKFGKYEYPNTVDRKSWHLSIGIGIRKWIQRNYPHHFGVAN